MTSLTDGDRDFLKSIEDQMGIVADVSRAESLLYGPFVNAKTTVLAHRHPHSVGPAYLKDYTQAEVTMLEMPLVVKALTSGRKQRGAQGIFGDGVSVVIEVWPIFSPDRPGKVIGAVSIDSSLLEHERQRRRDRTFRLALRQLKYMLPKGWLTNAENISPFTEPEGVIVVDTEEVIRYASGVAANLYRRLGYLDDLVGRNLKSLRTTDRKLFQQVANTLHCIEQETEIGGRYWVHKAIPLFAGPTRLQQFWPQYHRLPRPRDFRGALIIPHDVTVERQAEQEIRVKNAMIQEIHHRVKNNLQTVAALLRIQKRRVKHKEAALALQDAIQRILSVAVIHEFLSDQDAWAINIKDAVQRIMAQTRQSIVSAEDNITFQLSGPSIWMPAKQATAAALVINELLQNALEHGFEHRRRGTIAVVLTDEGDKIIIYIKDDGHGLPEDFDAKKPRSLGLQIATTLVEEDLKGSLLLFNVEGGTTAQITFDKSLFGGENGWNENES